MNNDIFPIIILIGRPAAGKSEIIEFLKNLKDKDCMSRFHIGRMHVIDDFPMIWNWFEEDALLSNMGFPRLYTNNEGYFHNNYFWNLLIERINLDYTKLIRDDKNLTEITAILEFSRGSEQGGYKSAFSHLSKIILQKAAIIYINVSWKESLRKNRKRFNPDKPDSILQHSLSDENLTKLYRDTDWEEISSRNNELITLDSVSIPFQVFENEDDVTSGNNVELEKRLLATTEKLWKNYLNYHKS